MPVLLVFYTILWLKQIPVGLTMFGENAAGIYLWLLANSFILVAAAGFCKG